MEKHNYVIPSDYEIETALAEGTAGHYSADDMWRTISSELEAAPPSLAAGAALVAGFGGGAAAILCLVMVLNWSSLFQAQHLRRRKSRRSCASLPLRL